MDWLASLGLAELAGISERKARAALARISSRKSETWRGAALVIRTIRGRGGRAGVQYQVRVDSLPSDLQKRLKASPKAVPTPSPGSFASLERSVLANLLADILKHPERTASRSKAIEAASQKTIIWPKTGQFIQLSPAQLRRLAKRYEAQGLAGLTRSGRSDKGAARVVVTAKYDAEFGEKLDLSGVGARLRDYIRAQHKNHESLENIRFKAARVLDKITREMGFEPAPGVCEIPAHIVKAEGVYRQVGVFKRDRKAWQDRAPGIRRSREGMLPNDVVVADVHPLDFLLPEVEGFQRYAKAICWLDVATNRIWMTMHVLQKGKGITNAHVIDSFIEMVTAWGLPTTLYLDNGSEYNWAPFIEDAMKLASLAGDKTIVRAKPYNPRAKPIEGIFGVLETHHFAKLPGWVGGNRMKAKTANIGRAPDPFPGTFEQFFDAINAAVALYHNRPQGKRTALAGRSPFEAYNNAVAAGWRKTHVEEDAFFAAFSVEKTCTLHGDVIQHGGRAWTCEGLRSYLESECIALIPKFEHWDRLPVRDKRGRPLGFAEPAKARDYLDTDGAKASAKAQKLRLIAVRELDASAPTIDPLAETLDLARELPKELPAPIGALVTASDHARAIAKGVKESPKAKRAREEAERQREAETMQALGTAFFENAEKQKAKEA